MNKLILVIIIILLVVVTASAYDSELDNLWLTGWLNVTENITTETINYAGWRDNGAVASGLFVFVSSLTVWNGMLCEGNYDDHVKCYNGSSWLDYGDVGSDVKALTVWNGMLCEGNSDDHVKCYNGSSWLDYGDVGSDVKALTVWNGMLCEGNNDGHVKCYDGSSWLDYGDVGSNVYSLAVWNGMLCEGNDDEHVKCYDGSSWIDYGDVGGWVNALTVWNGMLCEGDGVGNITCYDGSSWINYGDVGDEVYSLTVWNGMLCEGNDGHVKCYDGSSWINYGDVGDEVWALTVWNGMLCEGNYDGHVKCYQDSQLDTKYFYKNGDALRWDYTVEAGTLEIDGNISGKSATIEDNVIVGGYYYGQPTTGSIGGGIINSSENIDYCGCINVSKNGDLEIDFPGFIARVVNTDGTETYCDISAGAMNVTDDSHLVYYMNSTCEWSSESFENYIDSDKSPGNKTRILDIYTINGSVESIKGASLLMLANIKSEQIRTFCSSSSHLSVCNGFDITEDTFPTINVSSGNSVYLNTYLPSDAKSSLSDGMHVVHHDNGSWVHTSSTGLNITHCDNGTDLVECTGTVYRQIPIYSLNWEDETIIHQLVPLTTQTTYTTLTACKEGTPDYILPSNEEYVAVVHHIYCARRTDGAWTSNAWIDLRDEPVGAGGAQDLSIYLTILGTRELIANWAQGAYNFTTTTSWFLGKTLWSQISGPYNWLANHNAMEYSLTNATWVNSTNAAFTNIYGLSDINLENNLDGTGFNGTFSKINTGHGMNELYAMNQDVESTDAVTFDTIDTGQGANELYAMDQDVESTDAVTFDTIDTGQGANELYNMDQNVQTTDDVQFQNITSSGNITISQDNKICYNAACTVYSYFNGTCLWHVGITSVDIIC